MHREEELSQHGGSEEGFHEKGGRKAGLKEHRQLAGQGRGEKRERDSNKKRVSVYKGQGRQKACSSL